MQTLGLVTYLVANYDEAIAWFTDTLGWQLIEDTALSAEKRWVVVGPHATQGARLLLAKAVGDQQIRAIGNQAGGRVFLFLATDDFDRVHASMSAQGVRFLETPRTEAYGKVAVFENLYGNRWDLLQSRSRCSKYLIDQ